MLPINHHTSFSISSNHQIFWLFKTDLSENSCPSLVPTSIVFCLFADKFLDPSQVIWYIMDLLRSCKYSSLDLSIKRCIWNGDTVWKLLKYCLVQCPKSVVSAMETLFSGIYAYMSTGFELCYKCVSQQMFKISRKFISHLTVDPTRAQPLPAVIDKCQSNLNYQLIAPSWVGNSTTYNSICWCNNAFVSWIAYHVIRLCGSYSGQAIWY